MEKELIMVRFGELSTKGKNRGDFINLLGSNIKRALKQFSDLTYEVRRDHIYIHLHGVDYEKVKPILKTVSGLSSFSIVYKVENDIEKMKEACLELVSSKKAKTFKIHAKRAEKVFPMISDEINRAIASHILKNTSLKVDVHNPDLLVSLTIRQNETYIYFDQEEGAGGYPLGIGGKGLMMMSGGIDSPVACYLMMKRGVKMECIHFAAPPYTNEGVITKITDLCKILAKYQGEVKIYVVPFTHLQEEIYRYAKESYAITIMRRMMYRITERIAKYHNDLVIANGESIGQVASQTLKSMQQIECVVNTPVIRPLACVDKVDIIKIARQLGTYDISIRPFEDCCTIFEPKNPTTAPNPEKIKEIEEAWNWEEQVKECIANIKVIRVDENYQPVTNIEENYL
ncbi:MAG: tRNA 4-thiouridine(8) synthase ThiI [Bacillales bacterium]|nr:tRNA 4-thiouridine(8) synthase ThiI [Bacillales bacterium]